MQTVNRAAELLQHERVSAPAVRVVRPEVRGKFLYAGEEKFYVRGVTYGTFAPGSTGEGYDQETVESDFQLIADSGFNAVRVYTAPPRWLLDAAQRHGLRVMVGCWWAQNTAFLEHQTTANAIID